jgi:hypothetical protein
MRQYIIILVHRGQTIGPQWTQAGATTSELNLTSDHSQPYHPANILRFPLVAPLDLT